MPKSKAYRAIGFPSGDRQQIGQTLTRVLKKINIKAKTRIRAIAPSADKQDVFTAVFVFVDGTSRQCEGSHQLQPSTVIQSGSFSNLEYISIDSNFIGMTILHQPTEETVME